MMVYFELYTLIVYSHCTIKLHLVTKFLNILKFLSVVHLDKMLRFTKFQASHLSGQYFTPWTVNYKKFL